MRGLGPLSEHPGLGEEGRAVQGTFTERSPSVGLERGEGQAPPTRMLSGQPEVSPLTDSFYRLRWIFPLFKAEVVLGGPQAALRQPL